jgi:DNA mismatch repair protein MutS2
LRAETLDRLEWPSLKVWLAGLAQCPVARQMCEDLSPNLNRVAIEERWSKVSALRSLVVEGYRAPVGELPYMEKLFRAAEVGHIFDAVELKEFLVLLQASRNVFGFVADLADRCIPLRHYKAQICPLPKLMTAIDSTVGSDGQIKDTASKELEGIRRAKQALRKRIEDRLSQIMLDTEVTPYLQDNFFTIRSDRYVLPMTLDGRGRIKGSVYDASSSGQTLFVEPIEIAPYNAQLMDYELNERLEILRILRELSAQVAKELDVLRVNYDEMIDLDFLSAQAVLAHEIDGVAIKIGNGSGLDLRRARHPLLVKMHGARVVPNSISLDEGQTSLVISGPNAGGKTIVLKTVGLLHVMAKAGLLIPADESSTLTMFDDIHVELGDSQNLSSSLSTFSGHLTGLKPVVEKANDRSLVLLDELAVGTEPLTGAAIAQTVLERLSERRAVSIVTTHFDSLKVLAVKNATFRNGSMEFDGAELRPTYRLILDVPGQSFGLELATLIGFDKAFIDRARTLRGQKADALDEAVKDLQAGKSKVHAAEEELRRKLFELEGERASLEESRKQIDETRRRTALKLETRFSEEYKTLKTKFDDIVGDIRRSIRDMQNESVDDVRRILGGLKGQLEEVVGNAGKVVDALTSEHQRVPEEAKAVSDVKDFSEGDKVFVMALMKEGIISRIMMGQDEPIEVTAGSLKFRTSPENLRLLGKNDGKKSGVLGKGPSRPAKSGGGNGPDLVIPTPTNSISVRGMDLDSATDAVLRFLDQAVMRGEMALMIIHGHGTDRLKSGLRTLLSKQSDYQIRHRAGRPEEGGDGVTVVFFL